MAIAAIPSGTDNVDDIFDRDLISSGNPGLSGRTAIQSTAFLKKPASRCRMNSTIDATASEEGGICGVDDGINTDHFCDVTLSGTNDCVALFHNKSPIFIKVFQLSANTILSAPHASETVLFT